MPTRVNFRSESEYGVPRSIPLLERIDAVQESAAIWKTTFRIYTGFPDGTQILVNGYRCSDPLVNFWPSDEIRGNEIDVWLQCDRAIEPGEIIVVVTPY